MVSAQNDTNRGPPRGSLRSRKQGLQLTLLPKGAPKEASFRDLRILWPRNNNGNAWWGGGVLERRFKDSVACTSPVAAYVSRCTYIRMHT